MRVFFKTFGCRLNKAEALQMEADYLADGWELSDTESTADLIVVRGCSVTAVAQHDCEKYIAQLRLRYPKTRIKACGCLPSNGEAESLPLQNRTEPSIFRSGKDSASPLSTPLPTRTARAYLKVQDGCSGRCTFCIVPTFRGESRSVPISKVIDTAKRFLDAGYHELVVTGCNLSLYASEGMRLPELLSALAELESQHAQARSGKDSASPLSSASPFRIRLGSLEPGSCAQEVVHCMAEHANICRFLHLPIQSGSDRILAAMNRPYRIEAIHSLVETATRLMPRLGLGCDLMAGFPSETDADFAATSELLNRHPFCNVHVFPYSERPGTSAATFADVVPVPVRTIRAAELSAIAKTKREAYAQSFVGQTVEIVVEGHDKTVGWTGEYLRCEAEGAAPRKSLVRVRVTHTDGDRLLGSLVSES